MGYDDRVVGSDPGDRRGGDPDIAALRFDVQRLAPPQQGITAKRDDDQHQPRLVPPPACFARNASTTAASVGSPASAYS